MTEQKQRPILLDWDHFLVDSDPYYENIVDDLYKAVETELHLPTPAVHYRDRGHHVTALQYFEQVYPGRGEEVFEIRRRLLIEAKEHPKFHPGAEELLHYLAESHTPYAIVSDTPQDIINSHIKAVFTKMGLEPPIAIGRGGPDKIGFKPLPDGINKALDLLEEKYGPMDRKDAIMVGDKSDKDAGAAKAAGVQAIVVPDERSGDLSEVAVLPDLFSLKRFIQSGARDVGSIEYPKYVVRKPYAEYGADHDSTKIIKSFDCIEAPTGSNVDRDKFTAAEIELHRLRWLAKRGSDLDADESAGRLEAKDGAATAQKYTERDQIEAAHKVMYGFDYQDKDGSTKHQAGLFTDELFQEVYARVEASALKRRATLDAEGKTGAPVEVYLPERIILPRRKVENQLSIGFNTEMKIRLEQRFKEEHPELNIEFNTTKRILASVSIYDHEQLESHGSGVALQSVSGPDVSTMVQQGRGHGSLFERMIKQPLFKYDGFEKGDIVVLTDDHVQAGGTFITWWHKMNQMGVDIPAIVTLTGLPESKNLQADQGNDARIEQAINFAVAEYKEEHPDAKPDGMEQKFHRALEGALGRVGVSVDTLSNRESLTVMAYLINGQKPEQLEWFKDLAKQYGVDVGMQERDGDSILQQAAKPSVSPLALQLDVERSVPRYTAFRAA